MTTFADTFREARERAGLVQRDVADRIGSNRSYIGNVERGATVPTKPETIRAMADVLGLDADVLFAAAGRVPDDLSAAIVRDVGSIKAARVAVSAAAGQRARSTTSARPAPVAPVSAPDAPAASDTAG